MSIALGLQNLSQFVGYVIIALNLYAVCHFVNMCLKYRAERQIKLKAVSNFRATVRCMRGQSNDTLPERTSAPSTVHPLNEELDMLQLDTNRSGYSQSYSEKEHTLFISDSYGRVLYEVPFREEDYVDALCKVLAQQNRRRNNRY